MANLLWPNDRRDKPQIYRSVGGTLKDGGLLVIGNYDDFSIFLKQDGQFVERLKIGGGYHDTASLLQAKEK
jgi:hypothetical protein